MFRVALGLLWVLLGAGGVSGEDGKRGPHRILAEPPTPEEWRAIEEAVGRDVFKDLQSAQRQVILFRYRLYVRAPEHKRRKIEKGGLREYLLKPGRVAGKGRLSERVRKWLDRIPETRRRAYVRYAIVRTRQLELDRALARIPEVKERWTQFLSRYPEPFDPERAREANRAFFQYQVKLVAQKLRPELEDALEEEERQLERELSDTERKKLRERLGRKLFDRVRRREREEIADRILAELERAPRPDANRPAASGGRRPRVSLWDFVQQWREFRASPRELELLRYALRPPACPLLPKDFLGERPKDREARRVWRRDWEVLGRLEILAAATRLSREHILRLAEAEGPREFLLRFREIARERPRAERTHRRRRGPAGRRPSDDD